MIAQAMTNNGVRQPDEVELQGESLYESQVKRQVEPQRNGEFIALDIDSGDFNVDADELAALRGLRHRQPNARVYFARIGASAVYEMRSASLNVESPSL